jgi:Fe-S cluster assembly protein SufD
MTAVMDDKEIYLTSFAQLEKETKNEPAWLTKIRQSAIDRFAALGFPTLDDEEWRFTNLAPLTKVPFEILEYQDDSLPAEYHFPADNLRGSRLLLVNGYRPLLQQHQATLPPGVIVSSLAEALAKHPELVEPHLARYADVEDHAFTALNSAFLRDGAFVYLPKGKVIEEPIYLTFMATALGHPFVWHRRCLIVAGENSQANIVEQYGGMSGSPYFTSGVTELVLGEGAIVDHCKLQQEGNAAFHVHTLHVQQGRSSNFTSHAVNLGGSLVRNDIDAYLGGEGCECTLNGLYLAAGRQLIDNHTQIDHAKPHCASHELYKGILDGHAHGVFNGKIHVHPDAQKTDAKQTNQTLLLSEDAIINTKPQLEIYADDVKCTHGATVGQLDAEAIFYLRSRGIGNEEARSLLTFAFANDIIGRIKIEPLRVELEKLLSQRQQLPQAGNGEVGP